MSFSEAAWLQADRLAQRGKFDSNSIVLDLGSGTGINSLMLARKYGCKVLGVDIATGMTTYAREQLHKAYNQDIKSNVFFYNGTIESLVEDTLDGTLSIEFPDLFQDGPHKFTHLWSTCTLFQIRRESRINVFDNFAHIATEAARLVVDDAFCPNKV